MKRLAVVLALLAPIGCSETSVGAGGGAGSMGNGGSAGNTGAGGSAGHVGTGGTGGTSTATGGTGGTPTSGLFPLSRHASNRYLIDKNANPFLIFGDTAWTAIANLPEESTVGTPGTIDSIEDYLNDVVAKGFNAVLLTLPESVFTNHRPSSNNYYGDNPFTDTIGDFAPTNLNEPYWAHADHVIAEARQRNLLAIVVPTYVGYPDEGWLPDLDDNNSAATLSGYAAWLASRYEAYPNVMYMWGGDQRFSDWSRRGSPPNDQTIEDKTRAMATASVPADADALNIFHGDRGERMSAYWNVSSEGWLDMRAAYGGSDWYLETQAEYLASPARPVFGIEGRYENNAISSDQVRQHHWLMTLNGGHAAQLYGNENIWTFGCATSICRNFANGDWVSALNDQTRTDMIHLRDFLLAHDWHLLVPSLDTSVLTNGSRGAGTFDWIAVGKTSDDAAILVYTSAGANPTINLDALRGTEYAATWYDPADGSTQSAGSGASTGTRTFTTPGNNASGDSDWALSVVSTAP